MKSERLRNIILLLTISLVGFACSDFTTSPDSEQATINGRVESSESSKAKNSGYQASAIEGATVTAARITADGSLESIGNAEAETNAEGEFTIEIDAAAVANASDKIIVTAEKEGRQWKAIVYGKLENGSSLDLKPLSGETTGEASVYQQVVASGETDLVTKADVEAYIGTETAAEIRSREEAAVEFANALAAEARARAEYFADQSAERTEEQITEIKNAKAEALANLNASLYASSSQSATAEAYTTFAEAIASAHVDAQVDAGAYAKAKETASNLILKETAEFSDAAQSEVRANAALLVAIAVDKAVQARMEAAEIAESSVEAAGTAGVELRTALRTKATASASEVKGLFSTYNEKIIDILEQEFSANAEIIVGINSQINDTGGAKAALETSIEASADTGAIVQAYSAFYAAVETLVDNLLSLGSDTEAEVVADVMILVNLGN